MTHLLNESAVRARLEPYQLSPEAIKVIQKRADALLETIRSEMERRQLRRVTGALARGILPK